MHGEHRIEEERVGKKRETISAGPKLIIGL